MKKHLGFVFVSAFLFILVAALILVNAISFQGAEAAAAPVYWFGNITINADGTVSPSTSPVEQTGNVYNLTCNIVGGITVYCSNIVIGGNGYTVQGTNYTGAQIPYPLMQPMGFHLDGANNIIVTDTVVENFYDIPYYVETNWLGNGFSLDSSCNNSIYGNTVIGNGDGITLDDGSNHNNIYCNNISLNSEDTGASVSSSNFNTVYNNTLESNSYVHLFYIRRL